MKKNVSRLILEVGEALKPTGRKPQKISTKDLSQYTNKILVDSNELHKPSTADQYVSQQMDYYPNKSESRNDQVVRIKKNIKEKTRQQKPIECYLAELNSRKITNILQVQDVIGAIRFASKRQLEQLRPKLIKLENDIGFKLEDQELDEHVRVALESFLRDLNEMINKSSKVY